MSRENCVLWEAYVVIQMLVHWHCLLSRSLVGIEVISHLQLRKKNQLIVFQRSEHRSLDYILWISNRYTFKSSWQGRNCCYMDLYNFLSENPAYYNGKSLDMIQINVIRYWTKKNIVQGTIWLKWSANSLVFHINIRRSGQNIRNLLRKYQVHFPPSISINFKYNFNEMCFKGSAWRSAFVPV